MAKFEIEASEIDITGQEPRISSVADITYNDGDPEAVILSERADGKLMGYVFVFHPTEPVATIYRIRPDAIAGVTESGGVLVWDDERKNFPMERIASISPSYEPQVLTIRNPARTLEVRFTVKTPDAK